MEFDSHPIFKVNHNFQQDLTLKFVTLFFLITSASSFEILLKM